MLGWFVDQLLLRLHSRYGLPSHRKGRIINAMNDRLNHPKPADLPDDVKAELLRRRDAVNAGEPTIEPDKGLDQVRRNLRERSKQLPR